MARDPLGVLTEVLEHHAGTQLGEELLNVRQHYGNLRKVAVLAVSAAHGEGFVRLASPDDGDRVPGRAWVKGTVSDKDADVWVIVHPMETSDYWVQPQPSVKGDKSWKVLIHIGRPQKDIGKHFEIRAVANPEKELKEGKVLGKWPKSQWRSDVIEVIKRG